MSNTKFGMDQISSPPPLWWRRFERAYMIVLAPAITVVLGSVAAYLQWSAELKELFMQLSIFSVAVVKAFGMFLGSGEQYPDTPDEA